MPHFVLEYSANVKGELELSELFSELHETLAANGPFEIPSMKSRAIKHDAHFVGSGSPDNTFIHLSLAVLPGRDDETKEQVAKALHAVLRRRFAQTIEETPHSVTVEIRELDGRSYQKQSSIP